MINTEYSAAYSGGGYESVAQSDSQTSLHSASQLQPNRHSTVLNVSDPRYSATYGNPYLRSPPKHPQYSTYSTFSPSEPGQLPVSYITSPASTNTVHSMVSMPPPLPPSYPPHSSAGGSVIGVSIGSPSPSPHHRHPVSNDLYAVVSKPNGVMFRLSLIHI